MDFNIITPADLAKGGTIAGGTRKQRDPDDWIGRLTKEIPAEVIAVYLTVAGIVKSISNSSEQNILFWVVFIILLVLTPFYQWRVKKIKRWLQIGLSTGAFFIWIFTLPMKIRIQTGPAMPTRCATRYTASKQRGP